ncbi:MAG: hypothetical protein FWF76_03380 [Oscillospiraceae bacterium]|nr:hypothetical protein [Oscillospiraceae bacterium]
MNDVVKDMTMDEILSTISEQIPDGKFVKCYNAAEVPGELRIIVRRQGQQFDDRYVARMRENGYIELVHKP